MKNAKKITVKTGQIWVDTDSRTRPVRRIRIAKVRHSIGRAECVNVKTNRPSSVKLERFQGTHYQLAAQAAA